MPGKGLIDLRGKYVFLRHAIYSILRGRPVIIWGSLQNERYRFSIVCLVSHLVFSVVRNIVQALSIFVAGNNPGVIPWRTKSLKMSDLASFKLAGLVKTCVVPKAVEVTFIYLFFHL